MVFSSLVFICFFMPIFILVFGLLDKLSKSNHIILKLWIILGSVFFYWWGSGHEGLGFLSLVFIIGLGFGTLLKHRKSKMALGLGVGIYLLIMARYKYPLIFLEGLGNLIGTSDDFLSVISPLGMSFAIFHGISYLLDTYKGEYKEEDFLSTILNLGTYIFFFPKLAQGPTILYKNMVQVLENLGIHKEKFFIGLERFIIGLAKKVLMADILGDTLAAMPGLEAMSQGTAILRLIVYSFQLYLDFSAYSDMALGLSKMMGLDFLENFDFPYLSRSVSEFWRRWHMSLGRFFRTYVYFPLGGSREGNVYFNLMVVFFLTGVWHGNTLVYLFWGLVHGLAVVLERTEPIKKLREKSPLKDLPGLVFTNAFVFLLWSCFMYETLADLKAYWTILFGLSVPEHQFTARYFIDNRLIFILGLGIFAIGFFSRPSVQEKLNDLRENSLVFNGVYYLVLLVVLALSFMAIVSSGYSPFLYFQY